jgi:tetratricopeptide (TPR) repeat protein
MNITETYYLKALSHFPHELEECIENLNYALSYDGDYAPALCLMGRIYTDEVKNYVAASEYFTKALAADLTYPETFIHYSKLLLTLEKLEELSTLLEQAFKVPGIDKSALYHTKALAREQEGKFEEALELFHKALSFSFSSEMDEFLGCEIKRIEGKQKKLKRKKAIKPKFKSQWVKTYSY